MRAILVVASALALLAGCGKHDRTSPAATAEVGVRLTSIEGRVRVKTTEATSWIDATLGLTLERGDLVSTASGSNAKLRFHDGSIFDIRPGSLITIVENSTDGSRRPHVALGIESGEAHFETGPSSGDTKIEMPGGSAALDRATRGNVRVGHGGHTTIGVDAGRTRVESGPGRQLDIGPGQSLEIDAAGRAELSRTTPAPAPAPPPLAPSPEGVWSGVRRPPQLAVDTIELKGRQLHVAGRTEPDAALTVNGAPIPVQADGSFSEHVVLVDDAALISIRVTRAGNATTEHRLPVIVRP